MTINLGLVWGTCSDTPDVRELASGRRIATVAIRVKTGDEPATSVPVAVWDPPGWLEMIGAGDELVVLGRVRRRFYRGASGAATAKVELEAQAVARARDRRRVRALRTRAARALEVFDE
jgi:single-strand DNA-binding protein